MAASSPLASWSDQGIPGRPQYSSVRRGSNMRRKLTLPVEPPVRDDDGLLARMFSLAPLLSTAIPSTRPGVRGLAVDARHPVLKQDLDARFFRRDLQRPHQAIAGGGCLLHSRDRPACRSAPSASPSRRQCISRGTELPTEIPPNGIRRLVDKDDPVGDQPFEGRRRCCRQRRG